MNTPVDARREYRGLQSQYYAYRDAKDYDRATETLERMIGLVQNHRTAFDEAEDRIRVLRCQQIMTQVEKNRLTGWTKAQADLLRSAASWSTPSPCLTAPCAMSDSMDPAICVARRSTLSSRQARMCVERLNYLCEALKIEAAVALRVAEARDWDLALAKRRQAVELHRFVVIMDPDEGRKQNQLYLEYWEAVTEMQVLLGRKDFPGARIALQRVVDIAPRLDLVACFPNVFRDIRDIQAHFFCIDAAGHATAGDFDTAARAYKAWLNLLSDRASEHDTRYDSITMYSEICSLLAHIAKGDAISDDWERTRTKSRKLNLTLPTRGLLGRVSELVSVHSAALRQSTDSTAVLAELASLRQGWVTFLPDADLLAQERASLPRGEANLPSFLDVFHLVNPMREDWGDLLLQNLKHLLLVMGDYELKRLANPPNEEKDLPPLTGARIPTESMDLDELSSLVLRYLDRRDPEHARRVRGALGRVRGLDAEIRAGHAHSAITIEEDIFQHVRLWPHTILVTQQLRGKGRPAKDRGPEWVPFRTRALRMWEREPREITLEGPQQLRQGTFYYLRPNWNRWFKAERRVRHEEFHEADLPGVLSVFHRYLRSDGPADSRRFQDWIFGNFSDRERLRACRLLSMLRFYGPDDVREAWLRVFRSKFPPELKTEGVAYFGLGLPAKSGSLNLYYFGQALKTLDSNERSFSPADAFREISLHDAATTKPRAAIFIDDFIGTGEQAKRMLGGHFAEHGWLTQVPVYLAALAGFRQNVQTVKRDMAGRIREIFCADELEERDRAFSPANERWPSASERQIARSWAADIGADLVRGLPGYNEERDSLGWGGSEALVAFHYNIPNNTLPLFWAAGERRGRQWRPLFDRH